MALTTTSWDKAAGDCRRTVSAVGRAFLGDYGMCAAIIRLIQYLQPSINALAGIFRSTNSSRPGNVYELHRWAGTSSE